jgi:hypothetical protein
MASETLPAEASTFSAQRTIELSSGAAFCTAVQQREALIGCRLIRSSSWRSSPLAQR